ncbi:hypothetical protein TSAR_015878 [Trichomalopsis sarcophagae]|uniref:C2H2-type domain-containing protein n=1 Tax=Trichomalopsis sarcophagae TaxID=543379 RepID=A0A232FIQ2_9HYME|nr:hypothetical protein TSAR_015878 [Trichomalopsis sarcophagae]
MFVPHKSSDIHFLSKFIELQVEAEERDPLSNQDITIEDVRLPDVGILKTNPDEFTYYWNERCQKVPMESRNVDNETFENIQTAGSSTDTHIEIVTARSLVNCNDNSSNKNESQNFHHSQNVKNSSIIYDSEMSSISTHADYGQNNNESESIAQENTSEGELVECISTYKMRRKISYEGMTLLCTQCNKVLSVSETLYIKTRPDKCKNCLASLKFGCKMCRHMFNNLRTVQNHMEFYCGKEPRFSCLQCNYKTYWRCDLKKHTCKVRGAPLQQFVEILSSNVKDEYTDELRNRRKSSNNGGDAETTGLNDNKGRKQLNTNKDSLINFQKAPENTSIEPQTRYRIRTRSSFQLMKYEENEHGQQTIRNNNDDEIKIKNKQKKILQPTEALYMKGKPKTCKNCKTFIKFVCEKCDRKYTSLNKIIAMKNFRRDTNHHTILGNLITCEMDVARLIFDMTAGLKISCSMYTDHNCIFKTESVEVSINHDIANFMNDELIIKEELFQDVGDESENVDHNTSENFQTAQPSTGKKLDKQKETDPSEENSFSNPEITIKIANSDFTNSDDQSKVAINEGIENACIKLVTVRSLVNCSNDAVNKNALDSAHETSRDTLPPQNDFDEKILFCGKCKKMVDPLATSPTKFNRKRKCNICSYLISIRCRKCYKRFSSVSGMKSHLFMCGKPPGFKCPMCDYKTHYPHSFTKFESSNPIDPVKLEARLEDSIEIDEDFKMSMQSWTNFNLLGTQKPPEETPIRSKKRGRPRRNVQTIINKRSDDVPAKRNRKPNIKFVAHSDNKVKIVNMSFLEKNKLNEERNVEEVPTKRKRKPNIKFVVQSARNQKSAKKKPIKRKTAVSAKIQAQPKSTKINQVGGLKRLYNNSYEQVTIYCPEEGKKLKLADTLYIRSEPMACKKCGARLHFICTCGKKFKARRSVQNHLRSECNKYVAYKCDHCGLIFYYKRTLENHILIKHKNEEGSFADATFDGELRDNVKSIRNPRSHRPSPTPKRNRSVSLKHMNTRTIIYCEYLMNEIFFQQCTARNVDKGFCDTGDITIRAPKRERQQYHSIIFCKPAQPSEFHTDPPGIPEGNSSNKRFHFSEP